MPRTDYIEIPRNRAVVLRNMTCVYCGCELTIENRTKEHVIGRRFVPTGTLHQEWNLILGACQPCNVKKSDLEDDISVITMHADTFGLSPSEEARLEAERKKTKSRSRKTGKPVGDSGESLKINLALGLYATMTFNFTASPQIEMERANKLARLQMMGLFYFLTYDEASSRGRYWQGDFFPVMVALRSDWGNSVHRAFMTEVLNWEPNIILTTAKDHFQAVIRRHPSAACWSWAVEWNKSYRLVGFFGEREAAQHTFDTFPSIEITSLVEQDSKCVRYRLDTPLKDEDDVLFAFPASNET